MEDPAAAEKQRENVKKWALSKMAELFRLFMKNLWKTYKKNKKMTIFEGHLTKQTNHWQAFKEYKESEDAKELSKQNKKNVDKKKYHHNLGPGATSLRCQSGIKEQELMDEWIQPEWMRDDWELRARNWFLAHGTLYDEQTGDLICSDGIRIPRKNWKRIVKEIKEGKR